MLVIARSQGSIPLAAALLLLLAPPAAAQRPTLGQRIRVPTPQLHLGHRVDQLLQFDRGSVLLTAERRPWVVPRQLASQTDSLRGRRRHLLAGLAGGVTAGAFGAAIALSPGATCTGSGNYLEICRQAFAGSLVLGAGLGALVGTLIRTEHWVTVPLGSHQFDVLLGTLRPGQTVRTRFRSGYRAESHVMYQQGGALALSFGGSIVPLSALTLDSLWVKNPRDRVTEALIGAAVATLSVFVASIPLCKQERNTNPGIICGYSGFPKVGAMAGGAALGAVLGATIGFPWQTWGLRYARSLPVGVR